MMERSLEDVEELKTRIHFIATNYMTRNFRNPQERMAKLQELKDMIEEKKWNPYDKKILINFWEKHMALLVAQRIG